MTRQPDLPDLGGDTAFEHALLATAFRQLLADARPVRPRLLAEKLASDPDRVERTVAWLDQHGRIRRDPTGAVTGSYGLSLAPTRHELLVVEQAGQERRYWTWCAWDAVGILAALGASGRIRSTSPSSGMPIELDFHQGGPREAAPELVVFMADKQCCAPAADADTGSTCGSVIDDWCPLVNFFEDADAAQTWAAEHGVHGTAVPLADAIDQGKAAWTQWIAERDRCP